MISSPRPSLISAPRYSLGAVLLLWGWQTGFLLFAIPMIVLIELSGWAKWRWPITAKEFNNVADLSGVGFFITVVYIFTTVGAKGIFVILSVMPFVLLPLLLLQRYSDRGRVPVSALFVSLRRLDPVSSPEAAAEVDISLPYLLVCVVSASAGNQRTIWFFILVFAIFGLVMWVWRPQRYSITVWAGMLTLAMMLGYAGQEGIRDLQRSLEATIIGMFDQFMWRYRDPERATTSIGMIGRLKLSDRILLRVDLGDQPPPLPVLLREASYQKYSYGVWSNTDSKYTVIDPAITGNRWTLANGDSRQSLRVSVNMNREVGVVPVPHGTTTLRDVAAVELNQSQYGTVKMEIREGWVSYVTDYQDHLLTEAPPNENDLVVENNYRPDFDRLVNELSLKGRSAIETVREVERFFAENFTYTLTQRNRFPRGKFLTGFLFESREGHCEYFATSTVLLLRAAGIPARYVTGYAVDEYSPLEGEYLARSRDSHSWAIAWVNDGWRVVDTTPSVWSPYEDENASSLQPFMDLYAWISYRVSLFQTQDELEQQETDNNYLIYLLIPLFAILIWRLYFKERVTRPGKQIPVSGPIHRYGTDSALYRVIEALNRAGFVRREGETLNDWFRRVSGEAPLPDLVPLLALHYRYRFDPAPAARDLAGEINRLTQSLLHSDRFSALQGKNR